MRWEKNRKPVRGYYFVLSALVTLASWGIAEAETFNVTRLDDPTPDGCAPADCSLREAVIDANGNGEDDTILLPAGTYALALPTVGGDDPLGGSLDVTAGVSIEGAGARATVIDGGALDRVFDIYSTAGFVYLSDLTA